MAKPFSSQEAKNLQQYFGGFTEHLRRAAFMEPQYKTGVLRAADDIAGREAASVLKNVPVEELNRDKKGIRTKLLRDSGINNVADLLSVSLKQLEDINGISREGAVVIADAVRDMAKKSRESVHIRLSADDRNPAATALVTAVYHYKNGQRPIRDCQAGMRKYENNIRQALTDLQAGTGSLKWMFTPRDKKDRAVYAYNWLTQLSQSADFKQYDRAIGYLSGLAQAPSAAVWQDFQRDSIGYFTILEKMVPGLLGTQDAVQGLPEDLAAEVRSQQVDLRGLRCQLRRYQEWGVKYILNRRRVLLGDEMGLGKTVQAIAAMVSRRNEGGTHFVVVCPASVLTNWCREIAKHSDLPVVKVHGNDRDTALARWKKEGGVAVTTYETTGHFVMEPDYRFAMLVVDEAHYIKNPQAQRTQRVKALCGHAKDILFMTGTALENRVDEMVTLIKILQPGVAASVQGMAFLAAAPEFREKVAPVYYRRRREDVLTELPELIDNREWCTMNAEEETRYEDTVLSQNFAAIRRVSWNVGDLRNSSKAQRMLEIIEDAEEDGRKVLIFSFFLDTIGKIGQLLGSRCLEPITGAVSPAHRQEIVDQFNAARPGTVLTAQIQAGGTGLNIQAASVVILCEPQFKPSIENQAISRAYRMGQARNVLVYRLLCEDTVDERITELLEEKQGIFDAFADESAAGRAIELDDRSFGGIVREEYTRVAAKRQGMVPPVQSFAPGQGPSVPVQAPFVPRQ